MGGRGIANLFLVLFLFQNGAFAAKKAKPPLSTEVKKAEPKALSASAKDAGSVGETPPSDKDHPTLINEYLKEILGIEKPEKFNLSLKLLLDLKRGLNPESFEEGKVSLSLGNKELSDEEKALLLGRFSEQSSNIIELFTQALGRGEYNNGALLGLPGVGKTFSLEQIIALYSFGIVPEGLKYALLLGDGQGTAFNEQFRQAFLGKTQFVLVNHNLLSLDNTKRGDAFAKAELRMRSIVSELYQIAKDEFRKTGIRTVFIFEEAGKLPPLVQSTLLSLSDETGFKDPADKLAKGSESGFSTLIVTTTEEFRKMVAEDAATERRYFKIMALEPDEKEALKILQNKAKAYSERFELLIGDDALIYLIQMRRFLNNPPQAMPACILAALNDLFVWANKPGSRSNRNDIEITTEDTYRFIISRANLPLEMWAPTDDKQPLQDLSPNVKKHMVGDALVSKGGIVDQVVRRLKTGRSTGFRETPVFIILGPTGSGKTHLLQMINQEMFGHDGRHLYFSLTGKKAQAFSAIIEGNAVTGEAPLLAKAMDNGFANGIITFDEGKDLPSAEFDKLKTVVEKGELRPIGTDTRPRPLGLNAIAIAGQWGEEMFEGLTDDEAADQYSRLTEAKLIAFLRKGKGDGSEGAVPEALIQRALRTGGIWMVPRLAAKDLAGIVDNYVEDISKGIVKTNQIELTVEGSLRSLITSLATAKKRQTRGLLGLTSDLTETAVSESSERGAPARGAKITIGAQFDPQNPMQGKVILKYESTKGPQKSGTVTFSLDELLRQDPASLHDCEHAAVLEVAKAA